VARTTVVVSSQQSHSSILVVTVPAVPSRRAFASTVDGSEAITKLKAVFEEYRRKNFSQTIPPRFKKEMVTAADKNKDGMISVAEIEALLDNIGASEKLTRAEVEHCMKEAGVTGDDVLEIPVKQFTSIL
jgi:hypothetical protein